MTLLGPLQPCEQTMMKLDAIFMVMKASFVQSICSFIKRRIINQLISSFL